MPTSEYSKDTDRTTDVLTDGDAPFASLVKGHPNILKGLADCGFVNASPIQVAALPTIIAGNDTVVEAKNGTGKTLTFVIPTLMRLKAKQNHLQSIVLAPTREIAVQIQQCFKKVGQHLPELKCEYFIGGTPVEEDKQKANGCQIAVGSPGRIKHLLTEHVLKGSEVKSFILDEVDRLFTDKNFTKDIRLIDAKFPKIKQMIVVSASIDKNVKSLFDEFMNEYIVVKGADEDMNVSQDPSKFLLGIQQYVACVKAVSTNIILLPAKNVRLLNILQNLSYTQCIIFTNYMTRVEAVCNMLRDHDYKADYIRGDQDQNIRLKLVDRLTSFKSKILVATDLIARGIDSSNVDLVINMDCPHDWATYLHRIGRAGRFGNKGNAFTILDDNKELETFKRIINSIENVKIKMLPIAITKPILEYADNELENLNLVTELDALTVQHQNGNNVVEANETENNSQNDSESKQEDIKHNPTEESKPKVESKSIYGPGISEAESLQKLCKIVKETEKNLIENNLVDKRHLTSDRTFILFDPEPFLDDTAMYTEYSTDELIEIATKYNLDVEKYEADKKLKSEKNSFTNGCLNEVSSSDEKCLENVTPKKSDSNDHIVCSTSITEENQDVPQVNGEDKQLTEKLNAEKNIVNKANNLDDTRTKKNTTQKPRFSNVYDLFQLPDFSLLKTTHNSKSNSNNIDKHSTNGESSDSSNVTYNQEAEDTESVLDDCERESSNDDQGSWMDETEDIDDDNDDDDDIDGYNSNEYVTDNNNSECTDVENESSYYDDSGDIQEESSANSDKSVEISACNNTQQIYVTPLRKVPKTKNNSQQLVDYDILGEWYGQWRQQLSFIQTCVRMSKE